MQPAGQKCVFDVSDFVILLLSFLEAKDFQPFEACHRLDYSGDSRCLFPDGRLQPSTPPAFPTHCHSNSKDRRSIFVKRRPGKDMT